MPIRGRAGIGRGGDGVRTVGLIKRVGDGGCWELGGLP